MSLWGQSHMEKAVFMDRDGVIIEDSGYPHERDKIRFLPRVGEAIKALNENGFKVIVITNQAGVARGYFTEETVKEVNRHIQKTLAEQGAYINMIYYCPHHTEGVIEEYKKDCYCRKPNPGMIEKAVCQFNIDLRSSFAIGDHHSDIEAGQRTGCRTILLSNGDSPNNERQIAIMPDHVASDLYEAVRWLLKLGS
jgi:D-glycero-D-manno-heptose 1,7-bisphosphate phosphatase